MSTLNLISAQNLSAKFSLIIGTEQSQSRNYHSSSNTPIKPNHFDFRKLKKNRIGFSFKSQNRKTIQPQSKLSCLLEYICQKQCGLAPLQSNLLIRVKSQLTFAGKIINGMDVSRVSVEVTGEQERHLFMLLQFQRKKKAKIQFRVQSTTKHQLII